MCRPRQLDVTGSSLSLKPPTRSPTPPARRPPSRACATHPSKSVSTLYQLPRTMSLFPLRSTIMFNVTATDRRVRPRDRSTLQPATAFGGSRVGDLHGIGGRRWTLRRPSAARANAVERSSPPRTHVDTRHHKKPGQEKVYRLGSSPKAFDHMPRGAVASRSICALFCLLAATIGADGDGGRSRSEEKSIPGNLAQQPHTGRAGLHEVRGGRVVKATEGRDTERSREGREAPEGETSGVAVREAAVASLGRGGGRDVRCGGDARDLPLCGEHGGGSSGGSRNATSRVVRRRSLPEIDASLAEQGRGSVKSGHAEGTGWHGGRCWVDTSGRHRCQANVFLFGVSKCGEFFHGRPHALASSL